jgi:hypothetical protein
VSAKAGPLGGAAGSRGADVVVTAGNGSCQLTAAPVVGIADKSGAVLLNSHLPVGADGPLVSAAAAYTFSFQLSNWCDEGTALPLQAVLALASGSVEIAGATLAAADLPPCNGPGQPAMLSTTDWAEH